MQRWIMVILCGLILGNAAAQPRIALIIDDVGYNYLRDIQVFNLDVPFTISILPDYNSSKKIAQLARDRGVEVMLHLSMESVSGANMGRIGLARNMSENEKAHNLELALSQVPFAVGVNNHMGSLLTQDGPSMSWLMTALGDKNLYFVDSMTTQKSIAGETAGQLGVPWISRHVFLDNSLDPKDIDYQFQRALYIARQQGYAVVIAHPHPETYQFLKRRLPLAQSHDGIDFVAVSQLIENRPRISLNQ